MENTILKEGAIDAINAMVHCVWGGIELRRVALSTARVYAAVP